MLDGIFLLIETSLQEDGVGEPHETKQSCIGKLKLKSHKVLPQRCKNGSFYTLCVCAGGGRVGTGQKGTG